LGRSILGLIMAGAERRLDAIFGGRFGQVCRLAEEITGYRLGDLDPDYLVHRLSLRPEAGMALNVLKGLLEASGSRRQRIEDAVSKLVEILLVGTTGFFRHPEQFEWLRKQGLTKLAERFRELRLLSMGSSTGEEVWSLAMVAADVLAWGSYKIYAYEPIESLRKSAQEGRYERIKINEIDNIYNKYIKIDKSYLIVSVDLKRSVEFLAEPPMDQRFHLVMARNWLYYLRGERAREWAERLCGMVMLGGYLIVAPQEAGYLDSLEAEEIGEVRGVFNCGEALP